MASVAEVKGQIQEARTKISEAPVIVLQESIEKVAGAAEMYDKITEVVGWLTMVRSDALPTMSTAASEISNEFEQGKDILTTASGGTRDERVETARGHAVMLTGHALDIQSNVRILVNDHNQAAQLAGELRTYLQDMVQVNGSVSRLADVTLHRQTEVARLTESYAAQL